MNRRLLIAVFTAAWIVGLSPLRAAAPEKVSEKLIATVGPSIVRVEFDLQLHNGEAPTGVLDQDPSPGANRVHTLAQVIDEERPLESTGYVLAPDQVLVMDANIHPRFIKAIRVITQGGQTTTGEIVGRAVDEWAVFLKLKEPLQDAKPLKFSTGRASHTVNYYQVDGAFITEVLPFSGRIQKPDGGAAVRVVEHGGVATTPDGRPVGVLFSRRLEADSAAWQMSPAKWKQLTEPELAQKLDALSKSTRASFPRVRLSFRSPKNPQGQTGRFRGNRDDDTDSEATERDALGILAPGDRVLVVAHLRPTVTSRLQRVTVYAADGTEVPAKFEANLKDFGILVAKLERPAGPPIAVSSAQPFGLLGRLLLRADIMLHGENRTDHFYTARLAAFRNGPKMKPYPELLDMSDGWRAHIFDLENQLYAFPVARRERLTGKGVSGPGPNPTLTQARLVFDAVAGLPGTADPANVPVSEAEENRLAWLGVELQPLTRELARANNVSSLTRDGSLGALVTYVHPESPAAKASISPGTILLRLRVPGRPLPVEVDLDEEDMRMGAFPWERLDEIREQFFDRIPTPWPPAENNFTRALTDLGMGTRYTAEFVVDGKVVTHDFDVVQGPIHYESAPRFKSEDLGITVRNLTYDVRRYLQRRVEEPGVVVSKIEPGGKASVAGVKPFELITHVNDQPVASIADFEKLTQSGSELKLSIKRMAKGRIVTIKAAAK